MIHHVVVRFIDDSTLEFSYKLEDQPRTDDKDFFLQNSISGTHYQIQRRLVKYIEIKVESDDHAV